MKRFKYRWDVTWFGGFNNNTSKRILDELLWKVNWNSYALYQMALFTMTLDDLIPQTTPFYRASCASTVLPVIVCLSVCLPVTSRSCTKTAIPRITLTTSYNSPGRCQKSRRNSNDITPTGTPNRGGVGSHRRFSTNISLYLRNGAR